MINENHNKIKDIVKNSNKIAVILQEKLSIDELCSAMAVSEYLSMQGKSVQIFSSSRHLPQLSFFSTLPKLYNSISSTNELVIKVKAGDAKPKQLRYEKDGDGLVVYITPDTGVIQGQDVEIVPSSGNFDLFIILNSDKLEKLGALYDNNPESFYQTTKVVISNHPNQEYYGVVNWVDPSVLSLSEMVSEFIELDLSQNTNDIILSSLLAGIISQTQSFRDPRTTPQTLAIASKLVRLGARQQDIIQYLFKTKPFSLLQLWGRSLARVKLQPDHKVLYTVVTKQDFEKSGTTLETIPQVMYELATMANDYQLMVVGVEKDGGLQLFLSGPPHVKLRKLAKLIEPDHDSTPEPLLGNYHFISVFAKDFNTEQIDEIVATLTNTF